MQVLPFARRCAPCQEEREQHGHTETGGELRPTRHGCATAYSLTS
ncbi:MAG: hypothetical protein K8F29_05465 [Kofleriaceae bacterium]|nr:hypothetical protein [Candidatus Methylomirabilis lanthanidiphila]